MKSKKFALNRNELKSVALTLLLAALSAAVAKLIELLPGFNLGSETTMVIVLAVLKLAQKYLQGK